MEEAIQKFMKIKEKVKALSDRKIRLEERFKGEREKLEKLLKEISDKGYDPKKLSEIRAEKEKQLKEGVEELEKKVRETEEKLNSIEV